MSNDMVVVDETRSPQLPESTLKSGEQQQIVEIPLEQLLPHPDNPRGEVTAESVEDMVASIEQNGLDEPLIVAPIRTPGRSWLIKAYRVVIGHRQRKALEVMGRPTAPCIIKEMTEAEQRRKMLIENIQRKDLTPLQEARGFQRMMINDGYNLNDIAREIGVTPARVSNRLGILKLGAAAQGLFDNLEMPTTAVPHLLKLEDIARQTRLAQRLADWQMTVADLKAMIKREEEAKAADANSSSKEKKAVRTNPSQLRDARAEALTAIKERNGAATTFNDILRAMENTCKECGLRGRPIICASCPLPIMIQKLIERSASESNQEKGLVDKAASN
jgi:ParB family chromosome partitioning protein